MKALLALCLVFAAVSLASGFQTRDWVKFDSAAGNFSVLLPAQPSEEKKTVESPRPSSTSNFFTAREDAQLYMVGWVDYEPTYVFNPEKELDANRDNMVKALNGKLLSSKKISLGTYQGLEFTGEFANRNGKFLFQAQVFIVGKRPYLLTHLSPEGKESVQNRQRFFSSFKIRPRALNRPRVISVHDSRDHTFQIMSLWHSHQNRMIA